MRMSERSESVKAVHLSGDISKEMLRRSERHFRSLIEHSLDLITVVDRHGYILFQSKSIEHFLGYSPEEVTGKSIFDYVHSGDLPLTLEAFTRVLNEPSYGTSIECRLRHKDGSWHLVEAKALNLLDNPNISGIVINGRDLTERKSLEEEILKIGEREASNLGQDLHEGLSQHLVGLEFMMRVLQQKLKNKKLEQESQEVAKMADYLGQAIVQTRDLARGLYPFGLEGSSFSNILKGLAQDTERRFHIKCEMDSDDNIQFSSDDVALHAYYILREALKNSVKRKGVSHVAISLRKVGTKAVMSVRDNGHGIPNSYLNPRTGSLRIMDHRAKAINGSLDIQPNASGGVTVICSFPVETQLKEKRGVGK